ncbi:hypothetical protein, partial [Pantoea eucalypti]|uniref:hypothetical protein n=1 Tax=Pantoea eucalypti TaxID=470933 RepID=UPI00289C3227
LLIRMSLVRVQSEEPELEKADIFGYLLFCFIPVGYPFLHIYPLSIKNTSSHTLFQICILAMVVPFHYWPISGRCRYAIKLSQRKNAGLFRSEIDTRGVRDVQETSLLFCLSAFLPN